MKKLTENRSTIFDGLARLAAGTLTLSLLAVMSVTPARAECPPCDGDGDECALHCCVAKSGSVGGAAMCGIGYAIWQVIGDDEGFAPVLTSNPAGIGGGSDGASVNVIRVPQERTSLPMYVVPVEIGSAPLTPLPGNERQPLRLGPAGLVPAKKVIADVRFSIVSLKDFLSQAATRIPFRPIALSKPAEFQPAKSSSVLVFELDIDRVLPDRNAPAVLKAEVLFASGEQQTTFAIVTGSDVPAFR